MSRFILLLLSVPFSLLAIESISSRMEYTEDLNEFFLSDISEQQISPLPEKKEVENLVVETTPLCEGAWQVQFQFLHPTSPVTVEKQIRERELFLTFNQNVDSKDFIKMQEDLGYLIQRFSNGYNTLLFIAKKHVDYNFSENEGIFTLIITPLDDEPAEETWLLKLAEARFLYEIRDYYAAFAAIDALLAEEPENEEVLLLLSSLEGVLPRWQMRLQLLEYVQCQHPYDDDVWKLIRDTYTPHTPFISFDRQIQRTEKLATYQLYEGRGEYILDSTCNHTLYAGMLWQRYRGHVASIVNSEGEFLPFNGTRNQATLYFRDERLSGSADTAYLYAQAAAYGFGGEFFRLLPSIQGTATINADWHKPYWAVYETLAYHGTEDRLYGRAYGVYNRYITGSAGGGVHRVGIQGTPNGFTSRLLNLELNFHWQFPNPLLTFTYAIDGEYVSSIQTNTDAEGVEFNPVPFTTYEYHTVKFQFAYQYREWWNFLLFAGETINRFGINSPTYGISLKYAKPWPCGIEIELSAYQIPSATNQGSNTQYITGSMLLRF